MTLQRKHTRLPALGLAALVFAFTLAACGDSNLVTNTDDEATAVERSDLAARLSTDLGLSTEQANRVNNLLSVEGKPEPGYLWTVAAELQKTLTDAQKATLLEKAEQRRAALAEGMRGRRFNREGQRGEGRRFQRRGENGPGFRTDVLTTEQQDAMKALRETNRDAMKALVAARQNGSLTEEAFREQAKALRETNREALQALLTDAQKATLEQKRNALRATFEGRKDAAEVARAEALGLTADQEMALAEMREAHQAETRALVEQARAGAVDREALRTERQALREAHNAALADVLTPAQIETTAIHNVLMGGIARRAGRGGSQGVRGARGFRGQNR